MTTENTLIDPMHQKVVQRKSPKKYDSVSDYVCTKCGESATKFTKGKAQKCSLCGGNSFKETMRFSSDAVSEVLNRQLLYVAVDGMEFTDRLACEAYNQYLIGNQVEAEKCPQCGALYMVANPDRKRCENCGLSVEYFKRGFLKRPGNTNVTPHRGILR